MLLSKEQLSSVMAKHSERENGLHDLMEIMIESMMLAERREFLDYAEGNKGNGFRHGRAFGQGRVLEFRIPRDRYGNFHPKILALLRDQEMECERLAGILYCNCLLYTSDAADDLLRVDLGGLRIIKKKTNKH